MKVLPRAIGALAACLVAFSALPAGVRAAPAAATAAAAQALDPMVVFDALYIPMLSLTSAAQSNPVAAARATAASSRLMERWPALKAALAAHPPSTATQGGWRRALAAVERHLAQGHAAAGKGDWKTAHEVLEPVRIDLMQVRQAAGFEYFIDRLTAYHEPMEVIALAAAGAKPEGLDAARRAELERVFVEASARWRAVEQNLPDPRAYRLTPAREAQLRKGLADEAAAISRLSDALRGNDNAALLKAAGAIKPPFARVFTAFGAAEGETIAR